MPDVIGITFLYSIKYLLLQIQFPSKKKLLFLIESEATFCHFMRGNKQTQDLALLLQFFFFLKKRKTTALIPKKLGIFTVTAHMGS